MKITVYDKLHPGDRVRLVHVEGRELVTDLAIEVKQESDSAVFAGATLADRDEVIVVVDRAGQRDWQLNPSALQKGSDDD